MGHMEDPGHPNGLGHQTMFNAIDLAVFDPENIKKMKDKFHSQKWLQNIIANIACTAGVAGL